MSRLRWVGATMGIVLAVSLTGAFASAKEAQYFPIPGTSDQNLNSMVKAASGDVWVQQQMRSKFDTRDELRFLRVNPNGSIVRSTSNFFGYRAPMFPASDGGLWTVLDGEVSAGDPDYLHRLTHVSETGAATPVNLPLEIDNQINGEDGNQWIFARNSGGDSVVYKVSTSGTFDTIPAPGLDTNRAEGATSESYRLELVSTSNGIWVVQHVSWNRGAELLERSHRAGFISYQGTIGPMNEVPGNIDLVGPATGDRAWWIRANQSGQGEIGWLKGNGSSETLQRVPDQEGFGSGEGTLYVAAPGRDGGIVWAQDNELNDPASGQIGSLSSSGVTENTYPVPSSAVTVELEDGLLTSDCFFGGTVYQSADGSMWAGIAGKPSRITRTDSNGQTSLFVFEQSGVLSFNNPSSFVFGVESNPDALWLLGAGSEGPVLAKINPLDPPAPLKVTGSEPQKPEPTPVDRARIKTSLDKALTRVRKVLKRRGGPPASFVVHSAFAQPGTMKLRVELRVEGRPKFIGSGIRTGSVGSRHFRFRLNRFGVRTLKKTKRQSVRIYGQFRIRGTSEIIKRKIVVSV